MTDNYCTLRKLGLFFRLILIKTVRLPKRSSLSFLAIFLLLSNLNSIHCDIRESVQLLSRNTKIIDLSFCFHCTGHVETKELNFHLLVMDISFLMP